MQKRMLSLILCTVLCLLVVTVTAFADDTSYNIWVNGEQITSANQENVLGNGTVSFDPVSNTLTLNGATITNAHNDNGKSGAIYAEDDLTVNVIKDSTISLSDSSNGIYAGRDLTVSGTGNIKVKAGGYGMFSLSGDAIVSVDGDVEITAITGVFAYAGSATISGNGNVTIDSKFTGIRVNSGDVMISGNGDVTITADADDGIYAAYGPFD